MKNLNIEIDSMPLDLNPLTTLDYCGRYISYLLFEPLKSKANCKIKANCTHDIYEINIHQDYEKCFSSYDILNCLLFHLNNKNKSPFFKHLIYIKNAYLYNKGYCDLEKLGISCTSKYSLEIELERSYIGFEKVLQAPFIVPLNSLNKPVIKKEFLITNNQIKVEDFSSSYQNICFVLNDEINESINLYNKGIIDITCHTQFHHQNFNIVNSEELIHIKSDLLFLLEINDSNLKNFIQNFWFPPDWNNLVVRPTNTFIGLKTENIDKKNIKIDKIEKCRLTIAYSDFYPNNIIVDFLKKDLEKLGFSMEVYKFSDFNYFTQMNKKEFDIILRITFPQFESELAHISNFIWDIKEKETRNYYMNSLLENKEENFLSLNSTDHYLPIYNMNFNYMNFNEQEISVNKFGFLTF
ncbi:periplasmic substrate-binding domain-containing protein [Staphylococcus chromogenes]|uniref:hypothetical protein n=1 Tax=Staphylococcus chromogenes TaxID=46126 RepID=UPI001890753B|nr:hypothetical protein [Staphylococcus chromogenes]